MASKNCMLTAGHYIICSNHGTEASTITAYFGYQSNSNYWFKAVATSSTAVIYHDPEFTGSEKNYDYGYVVFNTDVGNTTGWFGLAARSNADLNGRI
jgi:V8-like Glu-specific endopeptidase